MKHLTISIIAVIILASGFSSCKKDKTNPSDIIQNGNWKVTLYNDSGTDETYHFADYSFTFNSNGSVSAVKSSGTVSGNWSTGTDDSQDKLILNFGATSPFDKLNDDWHIVEKISDKIRMEDVSGGGSGTDLLTFEKI
jgi:hypothetical protein